jgi:kallikrein
MLIFVSILILFVSNSLADNEDLKSCTLSNGLPGKCVQMHLCIGGKLNRNGSYIIDIRLGDNECHFLESCCDFGDEVPGGPVVTPEPYESTTFVTPSQMNKPRCGKRNPNGIGYRMLAQVENEAEYGEFPWMTAVLKKSGVDGIPDIYAGGGSLIHLSIVLTAAHIIPDKNPNVLLARVGEWDTSDEKERYVHVDHEVADLEVHPEFDETILYNDVALLFLEKPVYKDEHIGTVCLPPEYHNFDLSRCFTSGWGKNRFGKEGYYQTILKKIELPFVNHDDCQKKLRKTRLGPWYELHDSFVCAGGEVDKDSCVGDGGSPLVCPIEGVENHYYQAGIVAWGIACGLEDVPGVYVNVAKYRGWIEEKVAKRSYDTVSFTYASTIG